MRWLYLILVIHFALPVTSQEYLDRDSLWLVFKKSKPDTNRVKLYIQLGQQYEGNNPDSAILLYEQALELSQQLDYSRGIISYYTNVTYVYNQKGKYDTSLLLNLRSVEIAQKFGDEERLAACLSNVGASYLYLGQYEKAIEHYVRAMQLVEKLNHPKHLSAIYDNLSMLYRSIDQPTKSKEYGEKSLRIAREINNPYAIANSLNNLAIAHNFLGEMNTAIILLEEAREIARSTNNLYVLMAITSNMCDAHLKLGDYKPVKKYAEEVLALANQLDEPESKAIALRGLAYYYFNFDDPYQAEKYAQLSLDEAKKNKLLEHIGKAYSILAEIAILKKDFKGNTHYSFKSDSIRGLLVNETITKNIQNVEARYESEKKEQQIKDLKQQAEIKDLSIQQNRLLIVILMAVLISVVAIAWLGRRTYNQKKLLLEKDNALQQSRIAELEAEKQLLASEAVIKGQEEERGRLAKDLHDGLGGLLSGVKFSLTNMKSNVVLDAESALVFERSLDMLDNSISELRRVAHNMMPEVLVKFGLREALKSYCDSIQQSGIFKVDFQSLGTDTRLASNTEIILYRIVQELLNNASKYAKASTVLVQLAFHENEISITVEDNGVGFDTAKIQQSSGAGWNNIRSRVEYLKGKIDVTSGAGGTSVYLHIPV